MKKQWIWLLLTCLLTAVPVQAQVMQATVRINGMI